MVRGKNEGGRHTVKRAWVIILLLFDFGDGSGLVSGVDRVVISECGGGLGWMSGLGLFVQLLFGQRFCGSGCSSLAKPRDHNCTF